MTVGLVGFGRLGRLLARHIAKGHRLFVHDIRPRPREVRALGASPATLAEACAQDVVVLCVPISRLESVVRRARTLVRPGAVVVDACSVKERPVRVMKRLLPKDVSILAAHPNFGPDSAAESLSGRLVILCPVRISPGLYAKAKRGLRAAGLRVLELSPREHDKRIASSLALTHFIGRALISCGAETTGVDTEGYKRLLRILETVRNDTWQLFSDMNRYNAYAAPMRRRFLAALRSVDGRLR